MILFLIDKSFTLKRHLCRFIEWGEWFLLDFFVPVYLGFACSVVEVA